MQVVDTRCAGDASGRCGRLGITRRRDGPACQRAVKPVIARVISERVQPGELFTSFHFPDTDLNRLLSSSADESSKCPEYKVSTVRVEKRGGASRPHTCDADHMTAEPSTPATTAVSDAYPPPEIAARVCKVGLAKVTTPVSTMIALAVLAGAFISLGALFYIVTMTTGKNGPPFPFGLLRVAGGITFSLGLVLVVVGGAELFTGNNLIAMAWAVGCVQTRQVVRNWIWVYLGNLLGAVGTAVLVLLAGVHTLGDGAVGETMVQIARSKIALDPVSAFAAASCAMCWSVSRCGCVWGRGAWRTKFSPLSSRSRRSSPVASSIPWPTCSFFPWGLYWRAVEGPDPLSVVGAVSNLLLVTIGNIIGGTLLVAWVYWFVYLRTDPAS